MAKYLKRFELQSEYQAFKESEDWITPNVSTIDDVTKVHYTSRFVRPEEPENPEVLGPAIIRATFNSTDENMVALYNTETIQKLIIDGNTVEFEPPQIEQKTVNIIASDIILDFETQMLSCPDEYFFNFSTQCPFINIKPSNNDWNYLVIIASGFVEGEKVQAVLNVLPSMYASWMGVWDITEGTIHIIPDMIKEMFGETLTAYNLDIGFLLVNTNGEDFSPETLNFIDATCTYNNVVNGLKAPVLFETTGEHEIEIELQSTSTPNFLFASSSIKQVNHLENIQNIGVGTFYLCQSLTEITIPDSVTSIGVSAFYNCESLASITIPEGVTSIGYETFAGCTSLTEITIPDAVTSIGSSAFIGCESFTSIAIPESVTSIGFQAFYACSSLTSVYCKATTPPLAILIPEYLGVSGWQTFDDNAINRRIQVPSESVEAYKSADGWSEYADSITRMQGNNEIWYTSADGSIVEPHDGEFAQGNSDFNPDPLVVFGANIVSNTYENGVGIIEFDADITSIGYGAFVGCQFKSVTLPESVTSIGDAVFIYCTAESINIPNNVTSIGEAAFSISDIKQINIPEGVNVIKPQTFMSCDSLESVVIPSTVTSIADKAFWGTGNLTSIVCKAKVAPKLGTNIFGNSSETGTLYYPQGSNYSTWITALPSTWTVVEI